MKKLIIYFITLLVSLSFFGCESETEPRVSDPLIYGRLNNLDVVDCPNYVTFTLDTNHNYNSRIELHMSAKNDKYEEWQISLILSDSLPATNDTSFKPEKTYKIEDHYDNKIKLIRDNSTYHIAGNDEFNNSSLIKNTTIKILEYKPGTIIRGTFEGFLNQYYNDAYQKVDTLKDGLFILKYKN